ncbi:MAG: DNA translocase FtsK 4TM domain-containing protein, partial [Paracoccaceae bacterium]|nr:DNA translocase FtsK 4TM domain-containing protein [Paracoccaceae bacterium]
MASFQAGRRDPLVDANTQAMLERRGRELLGLALIGLGLGFAAMLASYSPEDPGWMVATDQPAHNMLGRFGAALASTLMIIGGKGAWAIAVVLLAWGLRFVLHRGEERALGRAVFALIAVAMASVFAATHVPGPSWPHSFGLGGLFGDTVLGALLGVAPVQAGIGLKMMSLLTGGALLAMGLYVTGFDARELRAIWRFLLVGTVVGYSGVVTLAGRGASTAARTALAMQAHHVARRTETAAARKASAAHDSTENWDVLDDEPVVQRRGFFARRDPQIEDMMRPQPMRVGSKPVPEKRPQGRMSAHEDRLRADVRYGEPQAIMPAAREKLGLLARVPKLMRRAIEPELVTPILSANAEMADLPSDERIKARISDVIRSRVRNGAPQAAALSPISAAIARREPAVTRMRGPQPLIAQTGRGLTLPAEPPVLTRQDNRVSTDWQDGASEDENFAEPLEDATDWDGEIDEVATHAATLAALPRLADEPKRIVQPVANKPLTLSRQASAEAQPRLRFDDPQPAYELPPLALLSSPSTVERHQLSHDALEENARMLESVLDDYGVKGEIVSVRPGPVVTMYELEPAPGLKASRVIGLADDIARSMSALSARVSTVPGRTVIGIELPNAVREKVVLREILSARDFGDSAMRLPLALGKDIGGNPIVANLAKMPHLLIAGTTGSDKSVAINTMILSLLYKLSPEECRMIMIDPKMLELSVYDGIPH